MPSDVLIAFVIFQFVFFSLDLYILIKTDSGIARKQEYTFFCLLALAHMFYLVFNSIWSLQEYEVLTLPNWLMSINCIVSYLSITGCGFLFFRYTIEKIQLKIMQKSFMKAIYLVPVALVDILVLTSPWTKLIFSIDSDNKLVEGPIYVLFLMVSSIYLLSVIIIAAYNLIVSINISERRSSVSLIFAMMIIVLFVVVDSLLPKVAVLPAAAFAAIIVIFMNMQESNIKSDALTGMNNRRKAYEYLSLQLSNVNMDNPMYLFMCDLNSFKEINDLYGHIEGDEALLITSTVLKNIASRYDGFTARLGGDEFLMCISKFKNNDFNPDSLIKEIDNEILIEAQKSSKPYGITISVGYYKCINKNESINECINNADEMLYENKRIFHENE
ncbi:diguanylate cyclase [bacterium]|nr:diguanylate cyclase [bacterium]